MSRPILLASLLLSSVGCDDSISLPVGGPGGSETGQSGPECPSDWRYQDDGVWLQPVACLAWSAQAESSMSWYDAVSPEAAVAGGCSAHCTDEEGYCSQLGELGGVTGCLPSRSCRSWASRIRPWIRWKATTGHGTATS